MRDQFQGFYKLTESELKTLWKDATIIFDTNALLNLYRYQKDTTDSLLQLMEKQKERIWIPYHVGLEFQRNRLNVIDDQFNRASKIKETIEKPSSSSPTIPKKIGGQNSTAKLSAPGPN